MKFQQETPEAIRQYLLGILPHEQMAQFEERLLADDELYEELLIGEEEILDDFLGDEVSPSERERIETYFLQTPARQEQLCFAGTLRSYASEHGHRPLGAEEAASRLGRVRIPPARKTVFSFLFPRNPALAFSLTSALLVVIVGGIWLAVRTRNHSKAPQTVWAVELTPGLMRDEGVIKTFATPESVDALRLQLDLVDDQFSTYQAIVEDGYGGTLATQKSLKARPANGKSAVFLELTANLLPPGTYRVKLTGFGLDGKAESLDSYTFKIIPR